MAKDKKKKKGSTFKKWTLKVHLWLGLASGLIIFILSVTGCMYVFHSEFTDSFRHEDIYVTPQEEALSLDAVWEQTQSQLEKGHQVSWATVYNSPEKSWVFSTYKTNPGAYTWFEGIEYYESVYVNQYTGNILGIYDEEYDFFNVVKMLHWNLLLSDKIGQPIVGWSTLIFVVLLFSGLVLWWPKNKKESKRAFSFQWKKTTKWKRKNYDLHNVLGFYVLSIGLILGLTGMVWSFSWFHDLVYMAGAGTTAPPKIAQAVSSFDQNSDKTAPYSTALTEMRKLYPKVDRFRIIPAADSLGTINVYAQKNEDSYNVSHFMQFDQYSGELLANRPHDEKNFGQKLIDANFDIHVGAILGMPGKIMAFIASLICATLPLTGFLVWINKKKKKKIKPSKKTKDYFWFFVRKESSFKKN